VGWWGRFLGRELPARDRGPTGPADGDWRGELKHGVWVERGEEKWELYEATYRIGVRHGPYRLWHVEGWLIERGAFVDGKKEGDVEYFAKDGTPTFVAAHRAGVMHGSLRQLADDGTVAQEREYRDGEVWAGVWDLKSSLGDFWSWRRRYKDGHPIGTWEKYDFRGALESRQTYDGDGVLDGPWSAHHDGGAVKLEGAYARGARTGRWRLHRAEGSIVAETARIEDGRWTLDGGTTVEVRDDDDLARWIALLDGWAKLDAPRGTWSYVESAVDAWPDGDRARAVDWVAARLAASDRPDRRATAHYGWHLALVRDGDPRAVLIDGLGIDHLGLGPDNIAALHRRAGQIRSLSFDEVDFDPGVDALFPPDVAWPRLEHVYIHDCGNDLEVVHRTFADATWTGALIELSIPDAQVADADAAALISSPHLGALRELALWPDAGDAFIAAIATAPVLAHVEELRLTIADRHEEVVAALGARETPALRELELRAWDGGTLSRATMISLTAKGRHPALERVELEGFEVPEKVLDEIRKKRPSLAITTR
jgi:antitoxin component YwqK of YwqJK toxin-antitoxin module